MLTALVTGLVSGWTTDAVVARKIALPIVEADEQSESQPSFSQKFRSGFSHADDLIRSIWRWLVIGVLVSAAITAFTPEGWIDCLVGYGGIAAMLAALLISLPLYVCATASVPIAASLVAAGLPLGAAIVFLMAGPATNVATIGAVYRGLGGRALAAYLSTLVVGSLAGGVLFEAWFLASGWTLEQIAPCCGQTIEPAWWQVVSVVLLAGWLVWCAVRDQSGSHSHHELEAT